MTTSPAPAAEHDRPRRSAAFMGNGEHPRRCLESAARRRRPRADARVRVAAVLAGLCATAAALLGPAHAETFDLSTATIADINAAIDAGALSSERLVELYLARIEAYDRAGPEINSVITLNEHALDEARALDLERERSGRRSLLHGVPVVLKDLIDVAGMPTTAGFVPFGAPVPQRDATISAKLKQAGAIVLAKVSTTNWFGDGFDETHPIGPTLNPYNLAYSPGGSSNGPGASLAAYFATVGVGTDTGGSVMIPSAYNGLVGMVATQGLVSRAGIVPRGATQDRAGPMGRSVYDIAVALSVISGWDAGDAMTSLGFGHYAAPDWPAKLTEPTLRGRRIGVLREMLHEGPEHEEGLAIFERALEDMRAAGALVVDPVMTGLDLKSLATSAVGRTAEYEKLHIQNAYLTRLGAAAPYATIQEMIAAVGRDKFSRLMVEALDLPHPEKSPEYRARLAHRTMLVGLLDDTLERLSLDAFVLPFSSLPPPPVSGGNGGVGNSLSSNNGLPAIIVPGGYTRDNLPIGIQFIGRSFDDLTLLQVAYGYEQSSKRRKTPDTTPSLPGERFDY